MTYLQQQETPPLSIPMTFTNRFRSSVDLSAVTFYPREALPSEFPWVEPQPEPQPASPDEITEFLKAKVILARLQAGRKEHQGVDCRPLGRGVFEDGGGDSSANCRDIGGRRLYGCGRRVRETFSRTSPERCRFRRWSASESDSGRTENLGPLREPRFRGQRSFCSTSCRTSSAGGA